MITAKVTSLGIVDLLGGRKLYIMDTTGDDADASLAEVAKADGVAIRYYFEQNNARVAIMHSKHVLEPRQ